MSTVKASVEGIDATLSVLQKLSEVGGDDAGKRAIYAGANVLANAIRANLDKNLQGSKYATGDLQESLGITPIKKDSQGVLNAKISFEGYDRKGVPNKLKGRVMESGSSKQPKKPFFRPAVNENRPKTQQAMADSLNQSLAEIIK